ncbi:transglycosylase domain-containing protein [Aureibaculum sp. 2210JD6-5]|uniref:penicillin-binding protein 1A n=1 Tax=Aureibaculum sp. 2210JD6-5 TaxID=3103957 RepID=UPI002AAD5411|nr:transglycosylase domain-containing protein [Aureibaculum sp. 2210JD6-5]MDY7396546.1 transglycosylase domain-containing protein [Aureibaculum sp. 2210JD6-5]
MTKKKSENTAVFKKYTKWLWILFLSGFGVIALLFLLGSLGVFGKLPTFEELENPENNLATEVISIDDKTLGKYFNENRTPIKYKDIPENIVKALIATEDVRFYEHSGIDFYGTARAFANFGRDGGASTVTQQLAKLLFHGEGSKNLPERLLQKIKEWIIALRLERQYTKDEIITMYFNKQDFLYNAVGLRSAARIYFGKEPKDLKIEEAAVLVAMLKNPSLYNPQRERTKKIAKQRRNVVLKQMERNEVITLKQKDSLQKLPMVINFSPEDTGYGVATYFREYLRSFLKDWVKDNKKPDGTEYNIYRDGLKIYVTLDSRMQQYAEDAMQEHMANLQRVFNKQQAKNKKAPFYDLTEKQIERNMESAMKRSNRYKRMKKAGISEADIKKSFEEKTEMRVFSWKGEIDTLMTPMDSIRYYKSFMRASLMSMEPQTGHVKAWVGGINYKHFQYDQVKQGKRQVGSTFKPFVYATAINQLQISPCEELSNTIWTIPKGKYGLDKDWAPDNSDHKYGGFKTLKNALATSTNVVTAQLIDKTTPQNVVKLAKNLGIENEIPEVPAIALGSVDLSLFEMTGAYNTFPNKGMYVKPMMVLRIEDKNGTVIDNFTPETKEVLSEESAYTVVNLLEGVTQFGSGARLRTSWGKYPDSIVSGFPYKFTNPIAGKTGTTQNQSDGWFMGFVPNLTTGVWVGGEDRAIHFADIGRGQGASMALPIWALYMKKCYADKELEISDGAFKKPSGLDIELDCEKYKKQQEISNGDTVEDPEF